MLIKVLTIFAVFGATGATVCHLRSVDDCTRPVFYFSHRENTTGMPINRQEHALMCRTVKNVSACLNTYFNECGTGVSKEIFDLFNEGYVNTMKTFCKNGEIKSNYLKYALCINDNVKLSLKYKRKCVSKLQATLESIDSVNSKVAERLGTGCCAFKRWMKCGQEMSEEECGGENAGKAFLDFVEAFSAGAPDMMCQSSKFEIKSAYCEKVTPRVREKPRGRKSDSVLSKYYSLFFPNIGF